MSQSPESLIIVGAGIVGSALAHFLSSSPKSRNITVVDRSLDPLVGSTGHAPGFVGQYNESEVLTQLAIASVNEYKSIPGGVDVVGGLEVAFGDAGIDKLQSRRQKATALGLPAEIISLEDANKLAPQLIKREGVGKALHFSTDCTANAGKITSFFQESAKKNGVNFLTRDVKSLTVKEGKVVGIEVQNGASLEQLHAHQVILATGIWAQDLCHGLDVPIPVVPVGHPYSQGELRGPLDHKMPFVRWPETHVYARDHGHCFGLGTYNHEPIHNKPTNGTAIGNWVSGFDSPLQSGIEMLPEGTQQEFASSKSFNGIFSMTPDNMPLAGRVPSVEGLCLAVAVWVTHAAGTAKFITNLLDDVEVDAVTKKALDPERFRGQDLKTLGTVSLKGYNEIYKTVESSV